LTQQLFGIALSRHSRVVAGMTHAGSVGTSRLRWRASANSLYRMAHPGALMSLDL
jgi:hypothetical protein